MALARRTSTNGFDIWPGFVDALATLLMVIIFLLMIFVVAQFFLNDAISGRDQALKRLNLQVEELADLLALERRSSEDLKNNVTQLSAELQSTLAARDTLEAELSVLHNKHASLETEFEDVKNKLSVSDKVRGRLERHLTELRQDITAMTALRDELAKDLAAVRTKMKKEAEQTAVVLSEERKISEAAKAQVALLNRQMGELRKQIALLNAALEVSESESKKQKEQIINLGKRLNAALASKVQELARYRSEFFGRLRKVLGDRRDIRVVGDRFVFQSEVLFGSGSAKMEEKGKAQLARLGQTLKSIARKIPKDLDWVLRVDGHTDRVPINTATFPTNWELSTARAISVVKFLVSQGIPARNLAATGFGEFRPLDTRTDEIAYRRNRRIELKLDQR
ncbi:MAG: peptidoglycan -binding protein [Pseudomonadota bacterium]|nr:peptidoglycan -binding protein [Pseudomonadota bacterium]